MTSSFVLRHSEINIILYVFLRRRLCFGNDKIKHQNLQIKLKCVKQQSDQGFLMHFHLLVLKVNMHILEGPKMPIKLEILID